MRTTSPNLALKKINRTAIDNVLHLAFYNSAQANIISIVSTGKIIIVNAAACKLLGYSKKELLTKSRRNIFDINDSGFKKMLKQRTEEGSSTAVITAIRKTGKLISCEITSAIFKDENGIEKSITSIADRSKKIQNQKIIDEKKEKIVANNIYAAKAKQKKIDIKNKKTVADNVAVALEISDALLVENGRLMKHIGKTSYDVMWDWNIASGQVYVGESIEEVFGYKLKNNSINITKLTTDFMAEKDNTVRKNLERVLSSTSRSWSDSHKIKRSDGSIASVNSRGAIVRDKAGKAIRVIGATQDITRLEELENKEELQSSIKNENTDIFHIAAKLSYDGIWDWNILTNEYFLGEGFEELFGYPFANERNETFNWAEFLHPDDKEAVEKGIREALTSSAHSWEHSYRFVRADGSLANVFGRATIIRDQDGKATRMIGVIHDISRQKELEEKLEKQITSSGKILLEYKENFRLMFNSSSDVLYEIDLTTDEILLSDGYQKEFGYPVTPHMKTADVWGKYLHPEDKEAVLKDYKRMLASRETGWKFNYRFLRSDGSVANIVSSRVILRDTKGIAYRMIGSMQDVSKQTILEEKLAQEIKLKEKQIADAMQEAKETERSDLGKELHDNVNQLLGVSRLYLAMAKQGGPDSEKHIGRSAEYTLNAIEEIRKLTKGLAKDEIRDFGLCDSIDNLISDMRQVNKVKISCSLDHSIENLMNDKFKLNVFRIVQEHMNNILKHAHAKTITLSLTPKSKSITLVIADNGVGFDTSAKRKGIGIDNIKSRAAAYNGNAEFTSAPDEGCVLTIAFRITDMA
jgi:PAS domain S-box-containing protein